MKRTALAFTDASGIEYGRYLNAQIVVEMVGSEQLREGLRELTKTIMQAHGHIEAKDFAQAWKAIEQFSKANEDFMNACRKELGLEDQRIAPPKNGS